MTSHEEGPPAKRPRVSFRNNIKVLVGGHEDCDISESFTVHTEVICARSSFFKAAAERWKTAGEPVNLRDDSPEVFDLYLQCLYHDKPPPYETGAYFGPFIDVYALADKLGDLRSANIIIDELLRVSDERYEIPGAPLVCRAWDVTPENSPLRRLMIDFIVHELTLSAFNEYADVVPREALSAIAKEFRRLKGKDESNDHCQVGDVFRKAISEMPKCHYHQHDETHPRCGT